VSEGFEPIDVAVVGGGISGLACAFWAKQQGRSVALFEASPDVGGSITTMRSGRYIADGGPQSFLVSEAFAQLVRDAQLQQVVMPASPAASTAYIYHHGRLVAAPRSPQTLIATPLLSPLAKLRVVGDLLVAKNTAGDESVASFVTRRAGRAVLENMVAPFVAGIFAGDPAQLSVRSAFPMMAEFEREHGSILRGAMARRGLANGAQPGPSRRQSVGFRGGNDVLPRALAARLGSDFTVSARVEAMWQRGQWMELLVAGHPAQRVIAKTIVIATAARVAADLLDSLEPAAAAALRAIEHPTVVQIAMAYPRDAIGVPLNGFGFLAARREGLTILGCVWNSAMFDDRCPAEEVLVTSFLGGATDPSVAGRTDEELARAVHRDLTRSLKIKGATPHIVAGFRWQEAIPQYNLGHADRLRIIDAALARLPNVRLAGNYLSGPSVPDCIKRARDVVATL
jgi:protoporphyrinogen/coproporphyrinogen III oxidase